MKEWKNWMVRTAEYRSTTELVPQIVGTAGGAAVMAKVRGFSKYFRY
jgi:hypothetical protein